MLIKFKENWNRMLEYLKIGASGSAGTPPALAAGIRFLMESPNKSTKTLQFGHAQIISTLKQIVSASSSSMTIGLFGNWGSGKSSIVENLRSDLLTDQIPVIIFDVWKHDGDALRRTFLKELDKQMSSAPYGLPYVKQINLLDPRVFSAVMTGSEQFSIKWKRLFNHLGLILLVSCFVLAPLLIILLLTQLIFGTTIFSLIAGNQAALSVWGLLGTLFTGGLAYKYVDSFLKVEKKEERKEKFQDPHEFESEFNTLIGNLNKSVTSIIIAFDNLDRVSGENALRIISTIKTFLEYKSEDEARKVIFLIPCDVNAIKNHIRHTLSNSETDYVDEFLRKFFNASLWIPDFYESELEAFATGKLKATAVADFDNDYLSWLIIRILYKNPRQIVQFINTLLAHYLILKEFCDAGHIQDKLFYSENVPQLAKFLLLKQSFPHIMDHLSAHNMYSLESTEIKENLPGFDQNEIDAFRSFLNKTRTIAIPSLEPYYKFRLSVDEQLIPDIGRLLETIQFGETDLSFVDENIIAANIPALSNALRNRFKGTQNPVAKFTFLDGCLRFSQTMEIDLSESINRELLNFLVENLRDELLQVDPQLLSTELFQKIVPFPEQDVQKVIVFYIGKIFHSERPLQKERKLLRVTDFLVEYHKIITLDQIKILSQSMPGYMDDFDFLSKFLDIEEFQPILFNQEFKRATLGMILKANPVASKVPYLKILTKLNLDPELRTDLFNNIATLIDTADISDYPDESRSVTDHIPMILQKHLAAASPVEKNQLRPMMDNIRKKPDLFEAFAPIVALLLTDDHLREDANTLYCWMINKSEDDQVTGLLEAVSDINIILDKLSLEVLFQRSIRTDGFAALLLQLLEPANRVLYFKYLIGSNGFELIIDLMPFFDELSDEDMESLVPVLIDKAKLSSHSTNLLSETKWILLKLIEVFENRAIPAPNSYTDLVMKLLSYDPDTAFHEFGLKCLDRMSTQDMGFDRRYLAEQLTETAYALNYSNIELLYTVIFELFTELSMEEQNKWRDLIFLHLAHHLDEDQEALNLMIHLLEQPVSFNYTGCETMFHDLIRIAASHQEGPVSSYYVKILHLSLDKLKKYRSASFKEIKTKLNELLASFVSNN
jgi:GTPase SAR1 family protein